MNEDTRNTFPRIITQEMLPSGIIKPRHLAAAEEMAVGDIYYVNASGIFQRLPIGTVGQKLTVSAAGLLYWA